RTLDIDLLLVASEVVAHEVIAQLTSPGLSEFLRGLAVLGDDGAEELLDRLTTRCGRSVPAVWQVRLTPQDAPAMTSWLGAGPVRLADLLRSPEDRSQPLAVVPLTLARSGSLVLAPEPDEGLQPEDTLLLAGLGVGRRALGATLADEATASYVLTGREQPTTWLGRRLARSAAAG
ncbi:MAG: hypothetical protein MUF35_09180, partial [Candidatus Nanopelagicales bacterium]|nr:hypothetical protein [Candidatus Nanopelagicales bacterium]